MFYEFICQHVKSDVPAFVCIDCYGRMCKKCSDEHKEQFKKHKIATEFRQTEKESNHEH